MRLLLLSLAVLLTRPASGQAPGLAAAPQRVSALAPATVAMSGQLLLTVPVHVHLVRSTQYPALQATLGEAEVRGVFSEVNRIWAPAGIRFEMRALSVLEALEVRPKRLFQRSRNWVKSALPLDRLDPTMLDLCFIREMGPNGFFYGEPVVVSETPDSTRVSGGSDHPVGRVAAHELGHVLTLQHRKERDSLMAPGLRGVRLNVEEIHAARQRALMLIPPPAPVPGR